MTEQRTASPTLRPLNEHFGAQVLDTDLRDWQPDRVDAILALLAEHALLLFRRQALDDPDLARLAGALGPVSVASKRSSLAPGYDAVMYVANLRDEDNRPIGGLGKADHSESIWHSDQSFRARPATLSTLFCLHAAASGGGTGFLSTVAAYAALSPALRDRIETLAGLYRPRPSHEIEIVEVSHPLVLRDPRTGRGALYVSELCHGIAGVAPAEGDALLTALLAHLQEPRFRYVHQWRMGDLLIYDNAQLLHRREAFEGLRWLKATRSFAPPDRFATLA